MPDNGELLYDLLLVGDPARDGVREYRGGVLMAELGVGGAELGGRPRSFLCAGVNGISARSSLLRKRGRKAMMIPEVGNSWRIKYIQAAQYFISALNLDKRSELVLQYPGQP